MILKDNVNRRPPRKTYSSVIHSLVEQLTRRSPFLQQHQEEEEEETKNGSNLHEIPLLHRNEIQIGKLLGQGNFSNVFEVVGFQLENNQIKRTTAAAADASTTTTRQLHTSNNTARIRTGSSTNCCSDGNKIPDVEKVDNCDQDNETQTSPSEHCNQQNNSTNQLIHNDEELLPSGKAPMQLEGSDENFSSRYAIKFLKPELLQGPSPKAFLESATDLVIEAKYLSRLNHPNILKVRGLAKGMESAFVNGEYDSFFILVDRLDETLSKRIKRWKNGELSEESTLEQKLNIALQIASALSYLHERRLVLRDVKPSNIGIVRKCNIETASSSLSPSSSVVVQLFDFGFCRELPTVEQSRDEEEITTGTSNISTLPSGETVFLMSGKGTRRYMAPEVLRENRYNLKADVYSYAVIFWEILTLHKPYYRYSKDQHTLFVCEGGERPPLEPTTPMLWSAHSFLSQSTSFSSIKSSKSNAEDSINYEQVMTDPIRDLLRKAWDHDVAKRSTMKEVHETLQGIIDSQSKNVDEDRNPQVSTSSTSDLSNSATRGRYNCLSTISEYSDMKGLVMELAHEMQELPIFTCFGNDNKNNHNEKKNVQSKEDSDVDNTKKINNCQDTKKGGALTQTSTSFLPFWPNEISKRVCKNGLNSTLAGRTV